MVPQLRPSRTFKQYIDDADSVIHSLNICCIGSTHRSSPDNEDFKPLGQLRLCIPPTHALQQLEYQMDSIARLPPLASESLTIYNEADTVNVFLVHIAQRCTTIFNFLFPHITLSYQSEWTRFEGVKADASLDLLWRVESGGCFFNLCFQEFKKPGSINIDEWELGVGNAKHLSKKAAMQSQQITRYHHLIKKGRSQLSDLATTITINLRCSTNALTLPPSGPGRKACAKAEVWFCKNGTGVGGDSVIRNTLMFLWECLKEDNRI
jgi:hypothetical protein